MTLGAILTLLYWLSHGTFVVLTGGAMDHPSVPIYGGNGIEAIRVAEQVYGRVMTVGYGFQVWPS